MSSLKRRLEGLEKLYQGTSAAYEEGEAAEELEKRHAAFLATLERAEEKAAAEEEAGDPRRRHALNELRESLERRRLD